MNEYVELLILAYFKEYDFKYSITDLSGKLGMSLDVLNICLEEMIDKKLLCINNNMIRLTKEGRIILSKSKMENYSFDSEGYLINGVKDKWSKDKVYPVHNFSKNKWRGGGE